MTYTQRLSEIPIKAISIYTRTQLLKSVIQT